MNEKTETQKRLGFPVVIREVNLGKDIETRREAIEKRDGRLVFICDVLHSVSDSFPQDYFAAIVEHDPDNHECYKARRVRASSGIDIEPKRLWYHDLKGLIEIAHTHYQQI